MKTPSNCKIERVEEVIICSKTQWSFHNHLQMNFRNQLNKLQPIGNLETIYGYQTNDISFAICSEC